MSTIFSKIIRGDIPCYKIAENDHFLAFLDVMPLERGHCLVIPKKENDYIFDLDDDTLSNLHLFAKKVAKALKEVVPCLRIGLAVVGLEVPHTHLHLVPLHSVDSLTFTKKRVKMEKEEFEALAEAIRKKIL